MKKRSTICLLLVLVMACMALTACGGSGSNSGGSESTEPEKEVTLETWIADHPEEMDSVEIEDGMEVLFEGNNLIYKYDLIVLDIDAETAKSDTMIEALTEALDEQADTFKGVASDLEEATEITGITVTVIYTYDGEVLVEKTFTN